MARAPPWRFPARGARRSKPSPRELGARVHVLPCDLGDKEQAEKLVPQAEAAIGGLDILVNNAGITRDMLFMRMKDEDWDTVLNVNLTSAFRLSRAALRGMMRKRSRPHHRNHLGRRRDRQSGAGQLRRRQGRDDRHEQIAGRRGRVAGNHRELRRAGLYRKPDDRRAHRRAERGHIARWCRRGVSGQGAEIAAAVVFLASAEAAYITGQTLHVNGGMAMI